MGTKWDPCEPQYVGWTIRVTLDQFGNSLADSGANKSGETFWLCLGTPSWPVGRNGFRFRTERFGFSLINKVAITNSLVKCVVKNWGVPL